MFKRIFWWTTGAAMGFGGSVWLQRKVRDTVQQYAPAAVQQRVQDSARQVGPTLKAAVDEGRTAMRQRQAELEATYPGGRGPERSGHRGRPRGLPSH